MLMGFLGYRDGPPGKAPPPPFEDPPEGSDDGDKKGDSAGRHSKSLFRRGGKPRGRYAWLISILIHGGVILGGFIAMRLYFQQPTPHLQPVDSVGVTSSSIVAGADFKDAVHYFLPDVRGSAGTGLHLADGSDLEQAFPSVTPNVPQTLPSLNESFLPIGPVPSDTQLGAPLTHPPLNLSRPTRHSKAFEPASTQTSAESPLPR
jgi:hypothetical protein